MTTMQPTSHDSLPEAEGNNLNRGPVAVRHNRVAGRRWSPVLDHSNVAITDRYISHLYPGEAISVMRGRTWLGGVPE